MASSVSPPNLQKHFLQVLRFPMVAIFLVTFFSAVVALLVTFLLVEKPFETLFVALDAFLRVLLVEKGSDALFVALDAFLRVIFLASRSAFFFLLNKPKNPKGASGASVWGRSR